MANPALFSDGRPKQPYTMSVFDMLVKDKEGKVTFSAFLKTAKLFRPDQPIEGKIKVIFYAFVKLVPGSKQPKLTRLHLNRLLEMAAPHVSKADQERYVDACLSDMGLRPSKDVDLESFTRYVIKMPVCVEALRDPLDIGDALD